jgi:hypothetical protein
MLQKDFEQANFTFTKPTDMTDEQCGSLRVYRGYYNDPGGPMDKVPCIISCWAPSKEDIEAINNGKPIWLSIIGTGMPPVSLYTENPFESEVTS